MEIHHTDASMSLRVCDVCVCESMYGCVRACARVRACMYRCAHARVCVCASVRLRISLCARACDSVFVCARARMRVSAHVVQRFDSPWAYNFYGNSPGPTCFIQIFIWDIHWPINSKYISQFVSMETISTVLLLLLDSRVHFYGEKLKIYLECPNLKLYAFS